MKRDDVCAIVVTYNRCVLLDECIEAILSSNTVPDILVIDNNSTDETKQVVEKYESSISYHNIGANIGGAGGFNKGLKIAFKNGYKYFWLMDDDTIVAEDTLSKLIDSTLLLKDRFGFLSSVANWKDGSICIMNQQTLSDDWAEDENLLENGIIRAKYASFVSLFIKRDVVQALGLPIKEYFIWGDDTEYSKRISDLYPSYVVGKSKVTHKMNSNEGTGLYFEMTDSNRIQRMFFAFRNTIATKRSQGKRSVFLYYMSLVYLSIRVLFSKSKLKLLKLKTIYKAMGKGFFFRPHIEHPE